jgi:hypothetical protein
VKNSGKFKRNISQ